MLPWQPRFESELRPWSMAVVKTSSTTGSRSIPRHMSDEAEQKVLNAQRLVSVLRALRSKKGDRPF